MTIGGAVITLSSDTSHRTAVLQALHEHEAIEIGEPCGPRLPIVIEVASRAHFDEVWCWIRDLEGVAAADLVAVHFDPPQA